MNAFQAAVARIALDAAGQHGFALAGGNALVAHGIVQRPTNDVDLFSNDEALSSLRQRFAAWPPRL